MKRLAGLLILSGTLFLVGCSSVQTQPAIAPSAARPLVTGAPSVTLLPGQSLQLPTPAQLNLNRRATQIVSAEYNVQGVDKTYSSEVQVEANQQRLLLVAVSGWGGQLFTINYNGITIKSSSLPMPGARIGIEHTLTDFIFTYASPQLLQKLLATTAIQLNIKPLQRVFSFDHQPILQIDYQNLDPWQGKVVIHNIPLNYTVTIQTISVSPSQ